MQRLTKYEADQIFVILMYGRLWHVWVSRPAAPLSRRDDLLPAACCLLPACRPLSPLPARQARSPLLDERVDAKEHQRRRREPTAGLAGAWP